LHCQIFAFGGKADIDHPLLIAISIL
jgi:hypothetical protein